MTGLTSTWERDFTVLRTIVEGLSNGSGIDLDSEHLARQLELTNDEIETAARNLERGHYAEFSWTFGGFTPLNVTERALRETGVWPNEEAAADALLWALQQKVDESSTAEERSRWTKIRDALAGAGRDITVDLAAAMTARMLGA